MNTILIVVGLYFLVTLIIGFLAGRNETPTEDGYFLADRQLPWYAVSLSMTGSNIGTEHFIGMVGTAWAFGMAPAVYEWGNFIPYSILLWIFLPFFFRKKLYTIPEYLEQRYNSTTRTVFAVFTLVYMVVGVLIPALYAGGRILYTMGLEKSLTEFNWTYYGCVWVIAIITGAYCIYGGLKSVVWTDVLQVCVLVLGGLLLVYVGMDKVGGVAEVIDANSSVAVRPLPDGSMEVQKLPSADAQPADGFYKRMNMLQPVDHPFSPWTGVATFWFTLSLWYVGTNQFYIQRCLGARTEWDAKMGVIGCAMLKLVLPIIIVFPGLIAFAAFGFGAIDGGAGGNEVAAAASSFSGDNIDDVYVLMIKNFFSEKGMLGSWGPAAQGILLAALMAAIMSTVSSVLNSTSTIWSFDIYRRFINPTGSELQSVSVGRISTLVVLVIGAAAAPLLIYSAGLFGYIQSMAALFAPPIVVIFLAGFLWRRTHGRAATFTLVFGLIAGGLVWFVSSLPWMGKIEADTNDPVFMERLTEAQPTSEKLKDFFKKNKVVGSQRKKLVASMSDSSEKVAWALEDRGLLESVTESGIVQQRLAATVEKLVKDEKSGLRKVLVADQKFKDALPINDQTVLNNMNAMILRIVSDKSFRDWITENEDLRIHLASMELVRRALARDNLVEQQIKKNPSFAYRMGQEPSIPEELLKDPAVLAEIVKSEKIEQWLAADKEIGDQYAKMRIDSWFGFTPDSWRVYIYEGFNNARPLLNRAAIVWVLCLIVLVVTTIWMTPDPYERFDPDAIWTPSWGRLPAHEQDLNGGPRNLMLWWFIMVVLSSTMFIIFR